MTSFLLNGNPWRVTSRVVLFVAIVLSLQAFAEAQDTFTDVGSHARELPAIVDMVKQGIMRSASPRRFKPNAPNQRGDFVVSVQRMFNLPPPARNVTFPDVPRISPIYSAVQAVAPYLGRQMLCVGCSLTQTLGPAEPVSRLEAAVVVTNILIAQKKVTLIDPKAD